VIVGDLSELADGAEVALVSDEAPGSDAGVSAAGTPPTGSPTGSPTAAVKER
jgi:hypothetical protein